MIVTLIQKNRLLSLSLPNKIAGRFWVRYIDENNNNRKLIAIEAVDGKWILKSNKTVYITARDNSEIKQAELIPSHYYHLYLPKSDERIMLVTEPKSDDRVVFNKFYVKSGQKITIGRDESNTICFNYLLVSSLHAVLTYRGPNRWKIADKNSSNGTFVNGIRVYGEKDLITGDLVYILGLVVIVGNGFIALNNPDFNVLINKKDLLQYFGQNFPEKKEEDSSEIDLKIHDYFDRSPRFKRDIERKELTIDSPPAPQKGNPIPMSLMLGPSLTMGIVSIATAGVTINNIITNGASIATSLTSLLMSLSMMLSCVLWPVLTKKFEQNERIRSEKERQKKYIEYIQTVKDTILQECALQSEIYNENCITVLNCISRVQNKSRNLWERTPSHNDFLQLRLGIGDLPLEMDIKYQEKRFSVTDDNLQYALYEVAESEKLLKNVPITLSLVENYVTGVIGERKLVVNFVNGLIIQLTALHSYDEVKLIFVSNNEEYGTWEYIRWLPHVWDNDKKIRFFVSDSDDVKELSSYLEPEVFNRISKDSKPKDYEPYYVVIFADKTLFEQTEIIKTVLKQKRNIGFSVITLFNELTNLPKECTQVMELTYGQSSIYDKNDVSGKRQLFRNDMNEAFPVRTFAVNMSNIDLRLSGTQKTLPSMITFLEMYGVGKIEHLNPFMRWSENDPTKTLQAPVGVEKTGTTMMLDLHEKFHGPHGLVAGMTGSGKSEFIITYILSMAVNYHPDEVAFILIDYKGGGLAGAFEDNEKKIRLPHLAGTITNLDGPAVKRSLISIQSELRRRQAIFNDARKISNEGTMDIYKYQKLKREGVVTEPIPHLFIISDEFAELKQQQPDFMEQLISAARIGRSLGVHLILATQKPNGVVDDQIWSNSRFRVCLKVQEKADSMDMIKRPDAASLATTGRFFLQVGFNEYFGEGQSAWSGASYIASDNFQKSVDNSIRVIDNMGRTLREIKPVNEAKIKSNISEIVGIVKYLSDLALEEGISVRPLWLDAIPEVIFIEDLIIKYSYKSTKYKLNPVIGELDDPFNQKQTLLTLPLSGEGNAIVYGAVGTGTDDFVIAAVYSLITQHRANEVNLYLIDFGAETLGCFSAAPQVGDILFSSDSEKICNLFKMLQEEMEKRKKLFSLNGGSYLAYCSMSETGIPAIVIVINNYEAFIELYSEYESQISSLTREGTRMGIYFVLTAATTNAVRYKVSQNFKQIFALQLNDKSDYPGIMGNTDGVYPSKIKGRGIVRYDKVYEFQIAYAFEPNNELEEIRNCCYEIAANSNSSFVAKRIPILPDIVDLQFVLPYITNLKNVPVGVEKESLDISLWDIQSNYISVVLGQDKTSLLSAAQGLLSVMTKIPNISVHLVDSENMINRDILSDEIDVASDLNSYIVSLFSDVVKRNNTYKDNNNEVHSLDIFERKVFLIFGVKKLFDSLNADEKDKLSVLLEKGNSIYKVHFIFCDVDNNILGLNYCPWYKQHISGFDGLWIGEGFGNQYSLKPSKMNNSYYAELEEGFGYVVKKGKTVLVKFLQG